VQQSMVGLDSPSGGRYGGKRAAPLAGLGYGLPISRLYSQYFGGDLEIVNRPGQGVDAYIHLSRLGDRKEPLV
jgi:pyruvate dehydrogenase kinase 2/3/4